MVKFARRTRKVEVSGIRRMFELAQSIKDPIDLSLGQPDFEPPEEFKRAARKAIDEGMFRYTVTQGLPELHEKLFAYFRRKYGYKRNNDAALITVGATGGLFLACFALVDEGDEVLIPDPYFVLYCHLVNVCGGTPVLVDTYDSGFRITPELLEQHATPNTRLLIFNNPVNPTGVAYRPEEVRAIAAWAKKRGIVVIADEVYNHFSYDFPHETFLNHYDNTVLVSAFSKTYGIPGWRLGYVIGPREIVNQMCVLQQFSYVCAPTIAQKAIAACLDVDMQPRILDAYRKKRDLIYEGLKDCYDLVKPQGAFYAFPRVPNHDADEFIRRALRNRLVVVPGKTGSSRNTHFRISFAASNETLQRGIEVLRKLAKSAPARTRR